MVKKLVGGAIILALYTFVWNQSYANEHCSTARIMMQGRLVTFDNGTQKKLVDLADEEEIEVFGTFSPL